MLELNNLYLMDCMDGMKLMENESVDLIATDPPYKTTSTCKTCKHLRIKDYVYGICLRTCKVVQPCNSCDEWEEDEERDFYAC